MERTETETVKVSDSDRVWELTLTALAREELRKKSQDGTLPFLRLGVKGGGCSGFSYHVQWQHEAPNSIRDLVFQFTGMTIVVDKKSVLYLNKSTIDWEKTIFLSSLKLINPAEVSRCSCGTSFQVK